VIHALIYKYGCIDQRALNLLTEFYWFDLTATGKPCYNTG
jgi:hypothetical protein